MNPGGNFEQRANKTFRPMSAFNSRGHQHRFEFPGNYLTKRKKIEKGAGSISRSRRTFYGFDQSENGSYQTAATKRARMKACL